MAFQVQKFSDDLESLGYMLLYFLKGFLPWQGLKAEDDHQKEEFILEMKKMISTKDLCENLPWEFAAYFHYIRSPGFDANPRYSYLRRIFLCLFIREGFEYDDVYDWTILKYWMIKQ